MFFHPEMETNREKKAEETVACILPFSVLKGTKSAVL
jgi:hypothetical protein